MAAHPVRHSSVLANIPPELAANQQYEILRELGRGGMGVVYLAKNKLMDRLEVLKVVNKALLDHPGAVERFLREIRSAAKLSHANVVAAYHALQIGELLAFAMEYVEGQDLASVVKSQGPLPVPHACFYVQQTAHGLQHAYEKGMVHRDIKPQNLILAREGKKHIVKVLDFGLAKVTREKTEDTGLTGEGKMLGTPDYIAPEQTLDAAHADIRADIYSLGCTLYYLLSGHPPFSASSLGAILVAHQMHEAKPLNLVRPEVPEELAAVVRKMMTKTPAKRYQTPREVAQALSPYVKQGTTPKAAPELSSDAAEPKMAVKKAAEGDRSVAPAAKEAKKQPKPAAFPESLPEDSNSSGEPRRREKYSDLTVGSNLAHGSPSAGPQKSRTDRKRQSASARTVARKKWLIGGGIGVGVLLLALLGMWVGGIFDGKVQVKTKDGILVIEVNEPNPEVLVDGETVTVSWHNGGKKAEIPVKPGTHKVEVKKGGFSVDGTELTFKDGDREVFTARLLPKKQEQKADAQPPQKPPPPTDPKKPDAPRIADAGDEGKGFKPLFNGKDLSGWEGLPGYWHVEDGALVGRCPPGRPAHTFLVSKKSYRDFDLKFQVRRKGGFGNSGVQFRSQIKDRRAYTVVGPQCEIDSANFAFPPGSLVTEPNLNPLQEKARSAVAAKYKDADFNDFHIRCIGKHVLIEVNGVLAIEGDFPSLSDEGVIAWQIHGGKTTREITFRSIEIKELLAESAPRRAPDALPPEAKAAAKAFEKARDDARAKLLAEFETVLDRLASRKGAVAQRLKMINVVKEEKQRFESKGLIPWSEQMGPYLIKYLVTSKVAEEKLGRVYGSLIEAHLRAKNESMVADLKADLENLVNVRVVARWKHFHDGKFHHTVTLYSNWRIGKIDGKGIWVYDKGVLIYRWPDSGVPGGVAIDRFQISPDGMTYDGTCNIPALKRVKIHGVYLKDE